MFLKAFRVKSSSQMKGSDKKKLKADLKKKFPSLTDDSLNALIPNKDEVVVSKVYTFGGDSLLVYYHAKCPLFFEFEKERGRVFPTVYALWRVPGLAPATFPTWSNVLPKIANGADLMLPGFVIDQELGEKAYHGPGGKLAKGDPVGVNLVSNRSHVAVGTAALSSEDMYMSGKRGKGVAILHFYGDQLWASGNRQELPENPPPEGLEFLKKEGAADSDDESSEEEGEEGESENEEREEPDKVAESIQDQDAATVALTEKVADVLVLDEKPEEEKKPDVPVDTEKVEEEEEEDTRSPQEIMDEMLLHAFLQAWKTSAKKAELPMLTSNFFRVHMVPQSEKPLDVKKSSHKKLSKFLAKMQKEGIVEIKELQKGVESITKVDLAHEQIQRHRVVRVQPKESEGDKGDAESVPPSERPYAAPEITELFMVSGATLPLFKAVGLKKGDPLTATELRDKVRMYVRENALQDQGPGTRGQVNLDPLLAGVALGKGENGVTTLPWEDLGSRLQAKMSSGYAMRFPGMATATVKKGKLDPVELSTATRSGNKKVTLVHNLELYGIDAGEFAHRCQTGVAASTSVGEATNRRPGAVEVLVQGNQVVFISKLLLETYRIPRKFIKGMEEGKKKKGGKK